MVPGVDNAQGLLMVEKTCAEILVYQVAEIKSADSLQIEVQTGRVVDDLADIIQADGESLALRYGGLGRCAKDK